MNQLPEIWDLFDENRIFLNRTIIRGEKIPIGTFHIVTDAWIINNKKEILITQRHPDKKFGLLWACVGGSAIKSEDSPSAILRELFEEIGIVINKNELIHIHTIRLEDRFVDTYLIKKDITIDEIKLEKKEIIVNLI